MWRIELVGLGYRPVGRGVVSLSLFVASAGVCEIRGRLLASGSHRGIYHHPRARLEAIAVDLPGHGQSTAPAVEYTAAYFSDSVAGLVDQLNLENVVYVGESIGASIGLILRREAIPVSSTSSRSTRMTTAAGAGSGAVRRSTTSSSPRSSGPASVRLSPARAQRPCCEW